MAMSPEEKAAYQIASRQEVEQAVDATMVKLYGRTFRGDAEDLQRAARLVTLLQSEKNGDGSHVPEDCWQKIKADFPSLFGTEDDAP